ncbi:hypothetical protein [Agarivorans sp.]|uniref:hypothetical protein n=1 Tax=Agarivorans sp. TaxID=1872412 RepID=UPI003CFC9C26
MLSAIQELKIRSKILLKQSQSADSPLVNLSKGKAPQLKHALLYTARQAGFNDWQHAQSILACSQPLNQQQDCGKFWYAKACASLLNTWCTNYAEALEQQALQGGIILPYKTQYVLASPMYMEALGLGTEHTLWQSLKHNWCEGEPAARQMLAYQRLMAMQRDSKFGC